MIRPSIEGSMTATLRNFAVVAIGAGCFGCSHASPTAPVAVGPCSADVSATIGSGTSPTFSWSPACKAFALLIEHGSDDIWYVRTDLDGIAPSVTYGVLPQNASQYAPAIPLLPGVTYDFILFSGTSEGNMKIIALREFTP
jgi:hypothetical protein